MTINPGTRLSHYEILSRLGSGGMGEVYLAQDTRLDRKVALKLLPAESVADPQAKKRLIREARAAAAIDHPNICAIHEVGEEDGRGFIVMQYIEGETLAARLRRHAPDLREALAIATQIADALADAHARGIIHRDIKPQNIMLTTRGQVKVLDFGLAKMARARSLIDSESETESLLSAPGLVVGTVPYMSPEQVRGGTLDGRSDIFSAGAVFYEVVTGRQAFTAENAASTLSAILTREPLPLMRFVTDAPQELHRIITKALRKDREERYQTAKDLLVDLKTLKEELEFQAKLETSIQPAMPSESVTGEPAKITAEQGTHSEPAQLGAEPLTPHKARGKTAGPHVVAHRRAGCEAAIIFVHGFGGKPDKTWGVFPRLLMNDPRLTGWDIYSLGYATNLSLDLAGLWSADPEIEILARFFHTASDLYPLGGYKQLVLIAHSMGGLVVQRALIDYEDLTTRVSHVFLFATPSAGLTKATRLARFKRQWRDLGAGSAFIEDLRQRWERDFGDQPPFSFLCVAGDRDEFVPWQSSIAPFARDRCAVVPGNHVQIVKPRSSGDLSVQLVLKGLVGEAALASVMGGAAMTGEAAAYATPITSSAKHRPRRAASRAVAAVLVMTLIVLVAGSSIWFFKRSAKVRWAREQAIPGITKLIMEDHYAAAVALAREAEEYTSDDPVWRQLWPQMSMEYSIITTPPGADVYLKEYSAVDREWEYFGKSPIERIQIPLGFVRWKIEKAGFNPVEGGSGIFAIPTKPGERGQISFRLDKADSFSPDMVRVTGGVVSPFMANIPPYPVTLVDYLIDRYEISNKQFKEFVAGEGYQKREYWKHGFVKAGRALTWEEAMQEFHDATGRVGPATWELGDFPAGQDDYPVGGVSWYEAAAYAEFARKSLPTLYHWIGAATRFRTTVVGAGPLAISPQSNFGGRGPASAGSFKGVGPFGTYDMAGNVREWCWNESGDQRYVMGGSWSEPAYMFDVGYSLSPFDRSSINGFRCVRYLSTDALPEAAVRPLALTWRDYSKEKPVSDDVFRVYQSLYSYDRAELNPVMEAVDESADQWIKQKVTFNAAYGNERVIAYLFLPKNAIPPYQTVIWLQGVDAFNQSSFPGLPSKETDFLMKSGRALLIPIYKGAFERQDGLRMVPPYTTASFRDHMIQWSKDLGRSIDYLESRPDIAHDKLAYYGASSGAVIGSVILALEPRIKTGVFLAGGLMMYELHPQDDPLNFVSRIKIPILMLNSRYDSALPYEASQQPLFRLLGTPEKDKRHRTFETQHMMFPRNELIKEVLDWLDHYLGPVK